MKLLKTIAILIFFALLGLLALQWAASETTGEVVVLQSTDSEGNTHKTRLWVVDSGGEAWLRAGQDSAGWYQQIKTNPAVSMTRAGETRNYTAVPSPAATDTVNGLMRAKYGWGESVISKIFARANSVAVRLAPAS